jgi:alkanesulfonate monooxygenase SsuD/methylene tetrahydromethanopterin reductase-like flavin-dependent oxidoreductase (luciferase family)
VAAAATDRVPIGTCVLQLPLRDPATLAKQATAVQLLSGGRFVLGLGVGSHAGEYEVAGVAFDDRGRLMDDGLADLRRIWAAGEDGEVDGYRQLPTSEPVPVWIGGSSGAARRRAARTGDGWVPLFLDPDQYHSAVGRLAVEADESGRDPAQIARAVVVFASVGGPDARDRGTAWLSSLYGIPARAFDRHLVAGPPDAVATEIDRYFGAGAEHVVVMVTDDEPLEQFTALVETLGRGTPEPSFSAARRPDPVEVPA